MLKVDERLAANMRRVGMKNFDNEEAHSMEVMKEISEEIANTYRIKSIKEKEVYQLSQRLKEIFKKLNPIYLNIEKSNSKLYIQSLVLGKGEIPYKIGENCEAEYSEESMYVYSVQALLNRKRGVLFQETNNIYLTAHAAERYCLRNDANFKQFIDVSYSIIEKSAWCFTVKVMSGSVPIIVPSGRGYFIAVLNSQDETQQTLKYYEYCRRRTITNYYENPFIISNGKLRTLIVKTYLNDYDIKPEQRGTIDAITELYKEYREVLKCISKFVACFQPLHKTKGVEQSVKEFHEFFDKYESIISGKGFKESFLNEKILRKKVEEAKREKKIK